MEINVNKGVITFSYVNPTSGKTLSYKYDINKGTFENLKGKEISTITAKKACLKELASTLGETSCWGGVVEYYPTATLTLATFFSGQRENFACFKECVQMANKLDNLGLPNLVKKLISLSGNFDKIISPEEEMGIKLAKGIMNRSLIEMIDLSEDYSIVELNVQEKMMNLLIRSKSNICTSRGCMGGTKMIAFDQDGRIYPCDVTDYKEELALNYSLYFENKIEWSVEDGMSMFSGRYEDFTLVAKSKLISNNVKIELPKDTIESAYPDGRYGGNNQNCDKLTIYEGSRIEAILVNGSTYFLSGDEIKMSSSNNNVKIIDNKVYGVNSGYSTITLDIDLGFISESFVKEIENIINLDYE